MKILCLITILSTLVGCATNNTGANWTPIVDRPNSSYYGDLNECQQHASKVLSTQDAGVNGAVVGAIFGALLGAAAGGSGRFNTRMAGVGALAGGVSSATRAEDSQRDIIRRCLIGRGHAVLN